MIVSNIGSHLYLFNPERVAMSRVIAYALILGPGKTLLFWHAVFGEEGQEADSMGLPHVIEETETPDLRKHLELYVATHTDLAVTVAQQIGPVYTLPNGDRAKAFICTLEVKSGPCAVPYEWLDQEQLRSMMLPQEQYRMAWDAFSVLGDYTMMDSELDPEGIIASDDGRSLLEYVDGERRTWARLHP